MEQEIEQRIWDYIDGHCTESQKEAILQLITENALWRKKYTELITVHELLHKEELDMPSLRFTKNVMEEIARYQVAPATKNYINKNVIRGIGSFFLIMISGLLIYFMGQIQWSGNATGSFLPEYSLDANKLNWSRLLNNSYVNIFLGVTAMLGLILLDKYMQTRKISQRTEP